MKSENQVMVQCKQPIKIEKAFNRLLPFPYSVNERNILQSAFLSFFFFSFNYRNALQSDNNSNIAYQLCS